MSSIISTLPLVGSLVVVAMAGGHGYGQDRTPVADADLAAWLDDLSSADPKTRLRARKLFLDADQAGETYLRKSLENVDQASREQIEAILAGYPSQPILGRVDGALEASTWISFDFKSTALFLEIRMEHEGRYVGLPDGSKFRKEVTTRIDGYPVWSLEVYDGEVYWSEVKSDAKHVVKKTEGAPSTKDTKGPLEQMRGIRERVDFYSVREGTAGELEVSILEGRLNRDAIEAQLQVVQQRDDANRPLIATRELVEMQLENAVKLIYYISKKTHTLVKFEQLGKDDAVTAAFELSKMSLDKEPDEGAFQYTPPEGVEVEILNYKDTGKELKEQSSSP